MIAKKVYVGESASSRSVGQPRKRWIDSMSDCSRKRNFIVGQARGVNGGGLGRGMRGTYPGE